MTKLEAVQFVMQQVGNQTVAALDTGGASTAAQVERAIDEASRTVQQRGWCFNTRTDVTLTPDGSGNITTPTDAMMVEATYGEKLITDQAGKLFDLAENTLVFDGPLHVNYTVLVAWTSLPATIQRYIAAEAAFMYYNRTGSKDPYKLSFLAKDCEQRKTEAQRADSRGGQVNVLGTVEAFDFRGRRDRGAPNV